MPAIVMKAYVLVDTDKPLEAHQAVFATFNRAVFESNNPITDFAIGLETTIPIDEGYTDGSFVSQIPGAQMLATANTLDKPC